MARIRNEGAGVRQHADETAQQTQRSQRVQLVFHAVFLVAEPPAGTELNLARNAVALEVAQHGADDVIVLRIQAVENGLGQVARALFFGQQLGEILRDAGIVDGVEAHVRAVLLKHARIIVAHCADVILLRPAARLVHARQLDEHVSFRKKSNSHYTGTNNLMFTMQRYAESTQVTGHAYAVLGGGSPTDLAGVGSLYGDKLSLERDVYSVPSASPNEATPWIAYTLEVAESRYVLKADNRIIANCSFSIPNYDYFGYLSLNCCTANILVDDFAVSVKDETLPPEILPLTAPVVKLDEAAKKIAWDYVDGASNYTVTVDGKEKTISANFYSLDRLTAGEHRITVRALSDDTFEASDSAESNEIVYTAAGTSGKPTGSESGKGCKSAARAGIPIACFAAAAIIGIKRKNNRSGIKSGKENG